MKICSICEEKHDDDEIVLVDSGIEDGIEWKRYKCLRTNKEWEHWDTPTVNS